MSKDRPAGMDDLGGASKGSAKVKDTTNMATVRKVASGRIETGKETAKMRGAKGDKGGGT